MLLAAVLTWAAHSSVAVVLLIMSFAAQGRGAAARRLRAGARRQSRHRAQPAARGRRRRRPGGERLPIGNLLNRLVGCVLALALLDRSARLIVALEPDPARAVADFHTAFNLVLAAAVLPAAGAVRRGCCAVCCRRASTPPTRRGRSISTGRRARRRPSRSPARRARRCAWPTCSRPCCAARSMRSTAATASGSPRRKRLDDVLDRLNGAIKAYLTALDPDALDEADHRRLSEILAFTTNLEHAGDVVDRSLMALAAKRHQARARLLEAEGGRDARHARAADRAICAPPPRCS